MAEERPTPLVMCEPDDPDVQLLLEPESWVHKWDNTQAGGEVCQFKMWLAGPSGPVKIIVRWAPTLPEAARSVAVTEAGSRTAQGVSE